MKFKDKLPRLRKNNNITQEQLADMLGVSRQAVSKWESGLSIPDMEKIIEMCKIFNSPIEELLDDGVTSNHTTIKTKSMKEYTNSTLFFITKTYKMFCSMKFFEKIKCIFEVCLIVGIQFLLYLIIGLILGDLIGNIINFLPWVIYDLISDISRFIYVTICFIIGTIITIHLFKVRYLNYFVIVQDKIEKTTKEEKEILDKPKETIIIRDINTGVKAASSIKKIWTIFLKFTSVLIAIPLLLSFVLLTFFTICTFIYIKYGIIFVGTLLVFLGLLLINYISLEFLYTYIFNMIKRYKRIFIIFISSLMFVGIGASLVFTNYLTFIRVENNLSYKEATYLIPLEENKVLSIADIEKENIIIDNSINEMEVTIEYLGTKPTIETVTDYYYCDDNYCFEKEYNYLHIYSREDIIFYINLVIKDFKNKNIRYYDEIENYRIKEIRISEDNLTKIAY